MVPDAGGAFNISAVAMVLIPLGILGLVICSKIFRAGAKHDSTRAKQTFVKTTKVKPTPASVETPKETDVDEDLELLDSSIFAARFPKKEDIKEA